MRRSGISVYGRGRHDDVGDAENEDHVPNDDSDKDEGDGENRSVMAGGIRIGNGISRILMLAVPALL